MTADQVHEALKKILTDSNRLVVEVLPGAAKPAIWWLRALRRAGVAAGLGQDIETFRYHSQVSQNQMIAEIGTRWGPVMVGGLPWQFSQTPCQVTPPPRITALDPLQHGLIFDSKGKKIAASH